VSYIYGKLFGVIEDSCIDVINGYLGYLSIQGELDKNKVSFLNKMRIVVLILLMVICDICRHFKHVL